jgi:radical SAM superfamily enzyme YgiQ (UPF0313 family)
VAVETRTVGAAIDPDGALGVTGTFSGTVDVGGGPLSSDGQGRRRGAARRVVPSPWTPSSSSTPATCSGTRGCPLWSFRGRNLRSGSHRCNPTFMPGRRLLFIVPALPPVRVTRDRPLRHNQLFTLPYLGLLSLGALTPDDYDVTLVNEHIEPIDFDTPCDLVGITVMTPLAPRAYEIADEFRRRGAKVVLGGLHPTNVPEEAADHADAVVRGEAEEIWPDVLRDFEQGALEPIYQKRPPFDLANLPVPDRSLTAKEKSPYDVIQATRGCVHRCEFCSVHGFHDGSYRVRPVASVVAELESLRGRMVMFVDDNLTANREWAKRLFSAMIPLGKRWMSMATIRVAEDEELLRLARASGCLGFFLGLESTNVENLKGVRKLHNVRTDVERALARIRRHGIGIGAGTVYGFDHDDPGTFDRMLDFAIDHDFSMLQVSPVVPFPGTRLRERFEAEGRAMDSDWSKYDFYSVVFDPKQMSRQELVDGMNRVRHQFYSWPSIARRVARTARSLGPMRTFVNAFINRSYRVNQRKGYRYPP